MKLNPDCIRDILLSIEDVTDLDNPFEYVSGENNIQRLKKYGDNVVLYHLRQCDMAGLLVGYDDSFSPSCIEIDDLSPLGHAFLADTRKPAVWEQVKKAISAFGSASLPVILEIAKQIALSSIKNHFDIT